MQQVWRVGEAFLTLQMAGETADIVDLFVPPTQRRQGVATQLMQQAIAELAAQGATELFLEVRAGNTPAIKLYRKLGGEEVGLRKSYYASPQEDAIIFRLPLV